MQHLIALRQHLSESIADLSPENLSVLVLNGGLSAGQLNYTVRIVLIDHRGDPLQVLALVQNWLDSQHRSDAQISFETEVIDHATFDLQVDLQLHDKMVIGPDGYHLCEETVWIDELGVFG